MRERDRVTWRTDELEAVLLRAARRGHSVVKFHSHPTGFRAFSPTDDKSDCELFPSVHGWVDDDGPHASVVMLADGFLFGRTIDAAGNFEPLRRVCVVGDGVALYGETETAPVPAHAERHAQLFGEGTTQLLRTLRIGIVGCSGTGSVVTELIARLGPRSVVLVDPDRIEKRNLNRILGSTAEDAAEKRFKVDVLRRTIVGTGLGVEVEALPFVIASRRAVQAIASCDFVFGCMDSHDGRRTLNRLASFYLLPYVDVGVSLQADGKGGIDQVCSSCNYLQPGGSSLLSRRAINAKRADAEAMLRKNPELYAQLRREGYIENAHEDRPAVISVNALAAALGVNEFLARVHPFRDDPNAKYAATQLSLSQVHLYTDVEDSQPCRSLLRSVGRGDVEPLLDLSDLSLQLEEDE